MDFSAQLEALELSLRSLTTRDEKLKAVDANFESTTRADPGGHLIDLHSSSTNTTHPVNEAYARATKRFLAVLSAQDEKDKGFAEAALQRMMAVCRDKPAPAFGDDLKGGLPCAPCANVQVQKHWHCPKEGTLTCSSCTLVSYCSASCQKEHWKQHKSDCKDELRQEDWQPKWIVEGRPPTFIGAVNESGWQQQTKFGLGFHLWGNMPATDVLRLKDNEGLGAQQDFALAFVASGDIRNLVLSVNGLPDDYSANLTLLLNDRDSTVTFRNLLLLEVLTTVEDINEAAELATHLWFSAFVPANSWSRLLQLGITICQEMQKSDSGNLVYTKQLASGSSFNYEVSPETIFGLLEVFQSQYTVDDAAKEYERIMDAPSRTDYRDRTLAPMKPSHRLSSFEHRRFGLVLPFGALKAHYNEPNRLLFSPSGEWLLKDSASPLEAWDPEEVIKSGRKHGATLADLYGCLYFHLQDQLRSFAARLRRFTVSLHLANSDMIDLAKDINKGSFKSNGLLPTTEFDRIEVSNTIDIEYLGVRKVLESWGSKLKKDNPHATLFGYSMNWSRSEGDVDARSDPYFLPRLITEGKIKRPNPRNGMYDPTFVAMGSLRDTVHNSGPAYRKYLEKHGIKTSAKDLGLKLKDKHSIMPPRPLAPLKGDLDALPVFKDNESWYLWTAVSGISFRERYLEFSRA